MSASTISEFHAAYAAEQIRRSRSPLRRWIKQLYLDSILREVSGPTIDFGCGAGRLSAQLPPDSIGIEVNPALISFLRGNALNAIQYDPEQDDFSLETLPVNTYETLVISHVLEHFEHADAALLKLLKSWLRLGIRSAALVVPTWRGYQSHSTHNTYIDRAWIDLRASRFSDDYDLTPVTYFPLSYASFASVFLYDELLARRDRA